MCVDWWRLQGGSREGMCVLASVFEARRAAGELENFATSRQRDLGSDIWRLGAESAASRPAVIDRGGPVRFLGTISGQHG